MVLMKAMPVIASRPFPGFHHERIRLWIWAFVLLVMMFTGGVRLRLLDVPLERDEGEYAYTGQLMLQGVAPFQGAYFMKLPGTHAAYGAIMAVFGQTARGIHLGLLIVNEASLVLVFLLSRKLSGNFAGLIACASFTLMSISPCVFGTVAHATQFVILFALAAMLALCGAIEFGHLKIYFLSGLFFGFSILMKQQGAFFFIFGLLLIFWAEFKAGQFIWKRTVRQAFWLIVGSVVPYALTCMVLWRAGVFGRFWFWTVTCLRSYASQVPFSVGLKQLQSYFELHGDISMLFWALAIVGAICLLMDAQCGLEKPFIFALLSLSAIAVAQGLFFRPHYFILILPAFALAVGAGVNSARRLLLETAYPAFWRAGPVIIFATCASLVIAVEKDYLFKTPPDEVCRNLYYPGNPFIESIAIADYIKLHTAPGDQIAVLGSEPQIYFYSGRRSATGYIYTYNLMETGAQVEWMQQDMFKELSAAKPELVVMVKMLYSWSRNTNSNTKILYLLNDYLQNDYEPEGVITLPPGQPAEFYWGESAARSAPASAEGIYVFRRKEVLPPPTRPSSL